MTSRSTEIKPKGPGEPALLRVSKQIRAETRSIYYKSNRFTLNVRDYDGAAFTPFWKQYAPNRPPWTGEGNSPNVAFLFTGRPNFENLVRWVKDYHHCASELKPNLKEPDGRDDYIIEAAFRMTEATPWVGWASVEKTLRAFQHGLRGTCSRWGRVAEDEDDWTH